MKLDIPIAVEPPPLRDEKPRRPFRFPPLTGREARPHAPVDPLNHVLYAGAESRRPAVRWRMRTALLNNLVATIIVGLITSYIGFKKAILGVMAGTLAFFGWGITPPREMAARATDAIAKAKEFISEKVTPHARGDVVPAPPFAPPPALARLAEKASAPAREAAHKAREEIGQAKADVAAGARAIGNGVEKKAEAVQRDINQSLANIRVQQKAAIEVRKTQAEAAMEWQKKHGYNAQCPYCRQGMRISTTRTKDVQCPSGHCQAIFSPKRALMLGPPRGFGGRMY